MIDEPGSPETRAAVAEATAVATSEISYVEARAAVARMRAGRRIGARAARDARRALDDIWLDLLSVPVGDDVLAAAANLADEHSLRGCDSVQLAAAGALGAAGEVAFVCWDEELRAAAARIGLNPA